MLINSNMTYASLYMDNSLGNGIAIQKKIQYFVSNILTLI